MSQRCHVAGTNASWLSQDFLQGLHTTGLQAPDRSRDPETGAKATAQRTDMGQREEPSCDYSASSTWECQQQPPAGETEWGMAAREKPCIHSGWLSYLCFASGQSLDTTTSVPEEQQQTQNLRGDWSGDLTKRSNAALSC